MINPSPRRSSVALFSVIAMLATACGTKEAPGPLQPSGPTGRVRFVNVITDTTRGRVNAILEGVPFGVNLTYTQSAPITLPAPSTAPYAAVLAGSRTFVLKRTADTSVTVASLAFNAVANQDQTIYAVGGVGGSAVTAMVTADSNPVVAATQVRIRFVHLSPTAGAIDVFITGPSADLTAATPTLANVPYRNASAYLSFAPGAYQIRAVPAGTPPANRAASVTINFTTSVAAGGARTIVAADNSSGGAPLRAFVLVDRSA